MRALHLFLQGLLVCPLAVLIASAQPGDSRRLRHLAIEWQQVQPEGTIELTNGELTGIQILRGTGTVRGSAFSFASPGKARMLVSLSNVKDGPGSGATIVKVNSRENPFSFFLRDVTSDWPIFIPAYRVVITTPDDARSYSQIETALKERKLKTRLQQIQGEPEETFDSAALRTRNQPCPTWLGISRDMRIFELSDNSSNPNSEMNLIRPRNAWKPVNVPELENKAVEYGYLVGRGQGVGIHTSRRLEDGVLPILHSTLIDGDIEYHSIAFASLERSTLAAQTPIGTDWLVADESSAGHMFTKQQEELLKPRLEAERTRTEGTVLYFHCEATNKGAVPRYAWFKTIRLSTAPWMKVQYSFDSATGFSFLSTGIVYGISRLNGAPLHDEEIAVLVKPGETARFEFVLPHTPISMERARALSKQSFGLRYEECKQFWKAKLTKAAQIAVPEQRINEMIQAGLLQLDLITYGNEPDSTLAPTIGIYSPIGTESSPIIQFYNSMGLPDIARRSLMYFIEKQHDNGMIQNFSRYMVETGAALWSMGEYYRYTQDKAWVRRVEPNLLKGADFLLRWRAENKKAELKGRGYGMISGKVADPEDPFHQYMLNGYAYLGLDRVAEMLKDLDPDQSKRLTGEARAWKEDIRASLMMSLSNSPVVPLGDGRWCPTVPPWTEAPGPRALHINRETFFSHGTISTPDVLLGPLYLVFCEVLAPEEPVSRVMLDYTSELFFEDNAAFSQPYYSRHDWLQLKLGLVKPFLKTYYNTLSALADRETYTFWEHLFQVSPHKTHEQAWFLMQTRWMLYLEEGNTLKLLSGIPRRWMEDGKQITLTNVQSYFGPIALQVNAHTKAGYIEASISCKKAGPPHDVIIRLPHPDGKRAVRVTGGTYDPATESISIGNFSGTASVRAEF